MYVYFDFLQQKRVEMYKNGEYIYDFFMSHIILPMIIMLPSSFLFFFRREGGYRSLITVKNLLVCIWYVILNKSSNDVCMLCSACHIKITLQSFFLILSF